MIFHWIREHGEVKVKSRPFGSMLKGYCDSHKRPNYVIISSYEIAESSMTPEEVYAYLTQTVVRVLKKARTSNIYIGGPR